MNVLFIAPYRQNDHWGSVSRNYIKTLLSNNEIKLTTRPYYYINNTISDIDKTIIECENSLYGHYDIIVQKLLPHSLYTGKITNTKNIGLINVETGGWDRSTALSPLNRLDEIIVNTSAEKKWLEQSMVKTPIKVIPSAIDMESLTINQNTTIQLPPPIQHTFKFYCVLDYNDRSNLDILIKAFHIAFSEIDRVSLIIKVTNSIKQKNDLRNHIVSDIEKIKKALNINSHYRNELIITEDLDKKNMLGLHHSCDCFVNVISGNNYCEETIAALFFGRTPIIMQNTGMCDFVNDSNGFCVRSEKIPVIMQNRPLSSEHDLFSANEFWYQPMIYSLIENMRKAYHLIKNDKPALRAKQANGKTSIEHLTYANIGLKLCT